MRKKSILKTLTVFSPVELLSSSFISENSKSQGSPLRGDCLSVSPSGLLTVMLLSSLPSARQPLLLQAPQVIFLVCLPIIIFFLGYILKKSIFHLISYWNINLGILFTFIQQLKCLKYLYNGVNFKSVQFMELVDKGPN